MTSLSIAVVGATGAVGTTMLKVLKEQGLPVCEIHALASARSAGKTVSFGDQELTVEDLATFDFSKTHVALFSAGGSVSLEHAPRAAESGAVVIDNTSAFRMEPDVPLVVPEVNPEAARERPSGIISNPNCSTIQMMVALSPLRAESPIERIVVSTYQSVSGAGNLAMKELADSSRGYLDSPTDPAPEPSVFSAPIGFNCLPQIDVFMPDGYTKEEHKMMNETRKIFGDESIRVSATCVRVPVMIGHAESVNVETEAPISPERARELLSKAPGVTLIDEPERGRYPLQRDCAGRDDVFVGRVRKDPSSARALDMWIVSDNLRKGAATNAVQIARLIYEERLCS